MNNTLNLSNKDDKHNEFGLKYIIIPIELLGNNKLKYIDMVVFAFINLLDNEKGCFASNAYLGGILNVSKVTISSAINTLIQENYIYLDSFDGRKRTIKVNPQYSVLHEQSLKNFNGRVKETLKEINNSISTNSSLISKDISTKVPNKKLNLKESDLKSITDKLDMTTTNKLNLKVSNSEDKLDINNNQSELNITNNQSLLNLANSEPKGSLHDSTESCTNKSFHVDSLIGTTNQSESNKAMFIGASDEQLEPNKGIDSLIGTANQPSQVSIVLKKRQVNQCLLEQSACPNQLDINIPTIAPAPALIKIGFQPPQLSQVRQKLKENPNTFKENVYQEIKVMKTPSYIKEIIDLWNEKGGRKLNEFQSNMQTQTYQDTISCLKKLLNGTMYNKIDSYSDYSDFKFTMEQIKSTILRFSLAAKNPDYEPKSQKTKNLLCKRSLKDFIFSGFSRSVNSDKEGFINFRSLFLFYFENKPVKIKSRFETQLLEDKYPDITDALIRFYYRKAQKNDVSIAEENYFINASVKFKNFYDKNKKELILFEIGTHTKFLSLLDLFKECMSEFYEKKGRLLPNYFNSYYTFEYTFKRFLLEKGVFESEMLPVAEEEFYDEN